MRIIALCGLLCCGFNTAEAGLGDKTVKEDEPTSRPDLALLPTTGPLTAAQVGSGVWWRPVFDETSVTQVMADVEKWGFRNLYVESFWGTKTIFPTSSWDAHTTDGIDWLEHISQEGAKHHIRVIAWMHTLYWYYPAEDNPTTPAVLLEHPEWIELTKDGRAVTEKDPSVFVTPAIPEIHHRLLSLVDELCSRSIDGINLDYVRYNSADDFGYNDVAVQAFRDATGIDARTIKEDTSRDSDWMKWVACREDMVTSVVRELSHRIRENGMQRGKRLLVTSAYFPGYADARGKNRKYQNWGEWIERGYLDVSTPMCYSPSLSGLEKELREVRSVHQGSGVACIPALAVGRLYSVHPPYVDQRKVLESVGFRHCAVFKYQTLKEELGRAENPKGEEDMKPEPKLPVDVEEVQSR